MLYRETVAEQTFQLLQKISALSELSNFQLAGGTSLSLQIGHRISYDLDFFSESFIPNEQILEALNGIGKIQVTSQFKRILVLFIDGIKVDFVRHNYKNIEPPLLIDTIKLTGLKDIAAMKINAITGRGRRRDFIDLYCLLKTFTLNQIFEFYSTRFTDGNTLMATRSLTFFNDAENDPEIQWMKNPISWDEVKDSIIKEVNTMLRST